MRRYDMKSNKGSKKKCDTMPKKKPKKKEPELIEHLSMWDWDTLVASWRYYEYGMTATSNGFPHDIVSRFWGEGNIYSDKVRDTIADQFVNVDHYKNGEHDWDDKGMACDRREWKSFYRFCEAWLNGFTKIWIKSVDGKKILRDGFHTDLDDRWYDKDTYIAHGASWQIPKENISLSE